MLGKLKSMINLLRADVVNFAPVKGMILSITGSASASNPVVRTQYNVSSVIRTSIGVYRITVNQTTINGVLIADNSVILISHAIQPSAISEAHFTRLISASDSEFDIEITEMIVGGGNKLEVNPYDIIEGDRVDVSISINAGIGKLPPE